MFSVIIGLECCYTVGLNTAIIFALSTFSLSVCWLSYMNVQSRVFFEALYLSE
jgi:hypothetical protein